MIRGRQFDDQGASINIDDQGTEKEQRGASIDDQATQ
jgi:hypothetical protein